MEKPEDALNPVADDPYPVRLPVVALIASAGGLEALCSIVSGLPADLPAGVLIALHQDPMRASELVAILQRSTKLAVAAASNGRVVGQGEVLVAPPGKHLLVTAATTVGLIESGAAPPSRPSADLLLATLAVTCGARALAVVLSGMGHDGQAGVRAIGHCGGTVLGARSCYVEIPRHAGGRGRHRPCQPGAGRRGDRRRDHAPRPPRRGPVTTTPSPPNR